ncbi:hypothetical protein GCM10028868_31740 [Virgibacillus kimchii]
MGSGDGAQKPADMDPEELPDLRAFQDEFTREFLQSTEETRDGYYPFLSGTGRYEMDFPGGGIIGERGYSKEDKRFESFIIGVDNNALETSIDFKYLPEKVGNEEIVLNQLSASFGSELDFKKHETENKTIYISHFETKDYFGYVAYIQNRKDIGGVQVSTHSNCNGDEELCADLEEQEKENVIEWLNNINFISESS